MLSTSTFYVKHWIRPTASQCRAYLDTLPPFPRDNEMVFLRLEDSLHYRALITGDYTLYEECMRTTEQETHTIEAFKALQANWDDAKAPPIRMAVEKGRLSIIDGAHRAAILFHRSKGLSYRQVDIDIRGVDAIGAALKRTAEPSALANGWSNHRDRGAPYGYHTFTLWNVEFAGQRHPVQRLEVMRRAYDFTGKRLIDLGCNTGGMIFHLLELASAHGVDADVRCIEAAHTIQRECAIFPSHTFQVANLDETATSEYLSAADVIFLLSMGSWLKQWEKVYRAALERAPTLFVEMNNDQEGVAQLDCLRSLGKVTCLSDASRDDATGNHGRKLYLVERA